MIEAAMPVSRAEFDALLKRVEVLEAHHHLHRLDWDEDDPEWSTTGPMT